MTEDDVARWLAGVPGSWPTDPSASEKRAEELADDRPVDRGLARLVRALHERTTAGDGLPPEIGGVRRETLVRWDDLTTTWEGRTVDGGAAMVRVCRPHAARDPVLRRLLLRDADALAEVAPDLAVDDGALPALVLPLAGPRLPDDEEPVHAGNAPVARWLATAIAGLSRWELAGLGLPRLCRAELRRGDAGITVACLTPTDVDADATADNLALVATSLSGWEDAEDPLSDRLGALALAPPGSALAAGGLVREAFAEELSGLRHGLVARWKAHLRESRHRRLLAVLDRMDAAVPAPQGRGAVGVDLDGNVTVLQSGPAGIRWQDERVWTPDLGFDPATARRLLRARAAAPPNARLNAQVGGTADAVEAITRWVAAGLQLRTVRLLLEKR